MRILITGSSGHLGREICRQLSSEHELIGIDIIPGEWTQHIINVNDRKAISSVATNIDAIIHTASLHQPHLATHSKQAFIDTNISGTLNLLEAGVQAGIQHFVYTSTTSLYGFAMMPDKQAIWVTEELQPQPRDIYDITKIAAEELCRHFAQTYNIPTICLRVSRFFDEGPKLNIIHRLYRGVDVRDAAMAHNLAVTSTQIPFAIFNISARSPLEESDLPLMLHNAPLVLQKYIPNIEQLFATHGWKLPPSIDRVYVINKAEVYLGYHPKHNFDAYIKGLQPT